MFLFRGIFCDTIHYNLSTILCLIHLFQFLAMDVLTGAQTEKIIQTLVDMRERVRIR